MTTFCTRYRSQAKFAKVLFLHLSVSHSVHRGVCPSACWDASPVADPTPKEQTPPPEQCMLGDKGNKQAVRIPLESILVIGINLLAIIHRFLYSNYLVHVAGCGMESRTIQDNDSQFHCQFRCSASSNPFVPGPSSGKVITQSS